MLVTLNMQGNPFIGVFVCANDDFALISSGWDEKIYESIAESLEVELLQTSFQSSRILGTLSVLNKNGGVFTSFASRDDLSVLPEDFPFLRLPTEFNVAGNNILCNDKGAMVHPGFNDETVSLISEVLGVKVVRGTLGSNQPIVGSSGIATNKGVIVHPHSTPHELEKVAEVLQVPAILGTANFGSPQLGACLVTNSLGAAIGDSSTPIEVGRIEDGLGYLD